MAGLTDYSKWDQMAISDSEEEDEDDEMMEEFDVSSEPAAAPVDRRKPRVTKLQGPTTVTIGGRDDPPSTASGAKKEAKEAAPNLASLQQRWTENGARVGDRYMWSQTKSECLLSILVPAGTKAKDVLLALHEPSDESCQTQRLEVTAASGQQIINSPLAYAVEKNDDEDEGLDWELKDFEPGCRVLQLAFVKKVPPTVVLWWARVFEGEEGIETKTLTGRSFNQDHQAVWEQAHAMFKKKVAERTITELDAEGNIVE